MGSSAFVAANILGFVAFLTVFYWPEGVTKHTTNTFNNSKLTDKWEPDDGKLKIYGTDAKSFTLWSRDLADKTDESI
jgi:hypothetical protein